MLNSTITTNIIRFILLATVQILIFNNLNFMGFINPMVYTLFLFWYPLRQNKSVFLLVSFALGFVIDIFSDTLALHTAATLTIAYLRPLLLRFCYGSNYEFPGFTSKSTTQIQRITLLILIVLIHHFILFTLEFLSFSHILLILKKVAFISIATILLNLLFISLFSRKSE